MMKKLAAELFGTFAVVFAGTGAIVINDVSTAGVAVGAVIAFDATFDGPISGVAMNPARSLAPALAAPILGSSLAVLACRCVQETGCCTTPATKRPENL